MCGFIKVKNQLLYLLAPRYFLEFLSAFVKISSFCEGKDPPIRNVEVMLEYVLVTFAGQATRLYSHTTKTIFFTLLSLK